MAYLTEICFIFTASPTSHPQLISQPTVIGAGGAKPRPKKPRAKPGPDSPQDGPYDNGMHHTQIRRYVLYAV